VAQSNERGRGAVARRYQCRVPQAFKRPLKRHRRASAYWMRMRAAGSDLPRFSEVFGSQKSEMESMACYFSPHRMLGTGRYWFCTA